jgi:hypothetical protein
MTPILYCSPLTIRTILNLSIRYAIVFAEKKQKSVEQLEGFPKQFGKESTVDVELTADTVKQLSDHELTDKSKHLVVMGLNLLHQRLLGVR